MKVDGTKPSREYSGSIGSPQLNQVYMTKKMMGPRLNGEAEKD